jgi:pectate lyase
LPCFSWEYGATYYFVVSAVNSAGESGAPVVGGSVVEPSDYYGYSLQNASEIKTIVTQGAEIGKIGF